MVKITNEVIVERLDNIIKQDGIDRIENKTDHKILKNGIAHTNGDVSQLKLNEAKRNGQIQILTVLVGSILVPLLLYFLKIKLFT